MCLFEDEAECATVSVQAQCGSGPFINTET